jgi:hypothetical protein
MCVIIPEPPAMSHATHHPEVLARQDKQDVSWWKFSQNRGAFCSIGAQTD